MSRRNEDPVLKELKMITKILLFSNAVSVEAEIAKVANNDGRKKMWVLMDGIKMPKELASKANVTSMTASNFLNSALTVDLIEYTPRRPPRRKLDYIPPSWLNLIELPKAEEPAPSDEPQKKIENFNKSDEK